MEPAIVMRNVKKSYKNKSVINGLNMTVNKGSIYALVGCSGCGKSTLISTILGLEKVDSGTVSVFGKSQLGQNAINQGYSVGYMPQDYSLYNELTVKETLLYFGMLSGMNLNDIETSMLLYTKVLELPVGSRRVTELSGGQKRRLSLTIAVFHNPDILLLDEPTVGVDPLLREKIWDYLERLVIDRGATILITTHYIDETRRSNRVGLLKGGQLISEASPDVLLSKNKLQSIEDVILHLWRNHRKREEKTSVHVDTSNVSESQATAKSVKHKEGVASHRRICALLLKNWFSVMRSFPLLLIMLIVPSATMFSMFIANGTDPKSLSFGVVNEEINNSSKFLAGNPYTLCQTLLPRQNWSCSLEYLSCRYVLELDQTVFRLRNFASKTDAVKAIKTGIIFGFVNFPLDFSWEFYTRAVSGLDINPDEFSRSNIVVQMDQSNKILTQLVKRELYSAYLAFTKELLSDCNYNPDAANLLSFKEPPLFGSANATFRDYIIPGAYIALMFYWPIVSSGTYLVQEKRTTTLGRSLVSGVKLWEIFVSFVVMETFIAFVRMTIMYGLTTFIFQMELVGSILLQVLLGLFSSYMGVSAGFLFGSFCNQEIEVAILSIAVFCPNIVLSGICWPIEGMPYYFKSLSSVLPCTLPAEAMRSIAARGWDLFHPNVWPGFTVVMVYTVILSGCAYFIDKRKLIK